MATTGRYLPMTPPPLPPLEFLSPEALRDLLQQKMRELVGGSSSGQPRAVRSSRVVTSRQRQKNVKEFEKRVVFRVKKALRPYFQRAKITREEYGTIVRKCLQKVQKAGIINDKKIEEMVEGYIQLKYSSPPDWH
ncbi:hypothetical protein ACOMHN_029478 [Nucella lapillus]